MSRKSKYTDEQLVEAVKTSYSYREVLLKLGLKPNGGNSTKRIKRKIEELNLDDSHFLGQGYLKGKTHNYKDKIPLEEILVKNREYNRNLLKARLLEEGLLKNKCEICEMNPEWNGKKLKMRLDHINGVRDDNRISNLRLICPNCDSQLDTYCGKNIKKESQRKKYKCKECGEEIKTNAKTKMCNKCYKRSIRKVDRPSRKKLLEEIKSLGYSGTGKKYGVSDNAVRKWVE